MSAIAKYAENLLSGKECSNCRNEFSCKKRNKKLYGTCLGWKESIGFDPSSMLRVVRLAYPNSIRGDIVSVQPLLSSKDTVFYIRPKYGDENDNSGDD